MNSEQKTRILIVEDHVMVADGFEKLLSDQPTMSVVNRVKTQVEALKILREDVKIDVVLMDLYLGEVEDHEEPHGLKAIRAIKKEINDGSSKKVDIIIVTSELKGKWISKAFRMGVKGYVLKDEGSQELLNVINKVKQGERYYREKILEEMQIYEEEEGQIEEEPIRLTSSEKEILEYISKGFKNSDIAKFRKCKVGTIETHRTNILQKLHAANAPEAVQIAIKNKLI